MHDLTPESRRLVDTVAARHGVEPDAVAAALRALIAGGGSMAQFSHPAFGGMAQWQAGGLSMAGNLFQDGPARKLDAVCEDLAAALAHLSSEEIGRVSDWRAEGAGERVGEVWWPEEFGEPAAAGAQDGLRYAVFPGHRRLVLDRAGAQEIYDTGEAAITGVGQQHDGSAGLTLATRDGPLEFQSLRRIETGVDGSGVMSLGPVEAGEAEPAAPGGETASLSALPPGSSAMPGREGERGAAQDVAERIELLGRLRLKGLVTEAEFVSKKAELLARL